MLQHRRPQLVDAGYFLPLPLPLLGAGTSTGAGAGTYWAMRMARSSSVMAARAPAPSPWSAGRLPSARRSAGRVPVPAGDREQALASVAGPDEPDALAVLERLYNADSLANSPPGTFAFASASVRCVTMLAFALALASLLSVVVSLVAVVLSFHRHLLLVGTGGPVF